MQASGTGLHEMAMRPAESPTGYGLTELPAAVRSAWRALVESAARHPSLLPEWIETAAGAHGLRGEVAVLVGGVVERPDGILPYYVRRHRQLGVTVTTVHLATNLVSYHVDAVGNGWGDLLLRAADSAWPDWDLFVAHNVLGDSTAHKAIEALACNGYFVGSLAAEVSPFVECDVAWDTYYAGRSSNLRSKVGRMEKRLTGMGKYETRWYRECKDVPGLLEAILGIEAASWKVSEGMNVEREGVEHAYYERLLPWLASGGWLLANVDHLDGRPVAYSLGYTYGGAYGQLKTSFVDDLRKHMIGVVCTKHALAHCFEIGLREFDFLGPDMPHKRQWAGRARAHSSMFVYSKSLTGRMLATKARLAAAWRGPHKTRALNDES